MKPSYKQIWCITYPILLSLMMEMLIGLTDTAFLGRVGEVELGASALASVYYMAIFMVGFGFSIGAQILIARRNGEKAYREIGPLLQQGLLFLIVLATGMFLFSRVCTPTVLRWIISSDPVYEAAVSYTHWRVYGFFFSFIAIMFRAFYVGTTNTKTLTINSITMLLTNLALNYVLIFGKCGFPAMGIAGAAIASSIAELASALFFVLYTWFKTDHRKYRLFHIGKFQPRLLGQMLNVSVWTMLQSFISVTTWFLFFAAVEHLGERPLAITNIIRSISGILFMVVSAFASTASALISNQMGAGQQQLVWGTCRRIITLCFLMITPVAILFALFPTVILRVYTDNISLINSSVPSLWVMLSAYVVTVPAIILFNTVSGTGNTRSALFLESVALIVYTFYVLLVVLYLRANVAVCWTTEHVYALVMLVLAIRYLKKADWQQKKI